MITLQIALFLVYAVTVATLFAALVPGYLVWLRRHRRPVVRRAGAMGARDLPAVDVVVPVHDEAALIERKLANLASLTYPPERMRLLIVDGASTDGTWERVVARHGRDRRVTLIRLDVADKTRQLNAGLAHGRGQWVVVTDADARLEPDTLTRLVEVGEADPSVAVVGATVTPERAHALERLHWRVANVIRRYESACGSASLVAAPCYAFRRTLIDRLPDDVVADDVHVTLAAAARGRRVTIADVEVIEQRSPIRLTDLFAHKRRKTDAYLREIFRFLPRVWQMPSPARAIFLWRAAHLTVLPVLLALGALGSALALSQSHLPPGVRLVLPGVAAVLFVASWWGIGRGSSPVLLVAHGVLLTAVTLAALVSYPFTRQTSAFPKVAGGALRRRGGT